MQIGKLKTQYIVLYLYLMSSYWLIFIVRRILYFECGVSRTTKGALTIEKSNDAEETKDKQVCECVMLDLWAGSSTPYLFYL